MTINDITKKNCKQRQLRKKLLLNGSLTVFAIALIFAGTTAWQNYHQRYLRLGKKIVSERVEVYGGNAEDGRLFNPQQFMYETDFERRLIETDKLFTTEKIADLKNIHSQQIGQLPLIFRFFAYAEAGLFDNANKVFETIQNSGEDSLINHVIEATSNIRVQKSIEHLLLFKNKGDYIPEYPAIKALAKLNATKATAQLIILMSDNDEGVRSSAIEAIHGLTLEKGQILQIIPLLKNNNVDVRNSAIFALRHSRPDEETLLQMMPLLKDNNVDVRRGALYVLGNSPLKAEAATQIAGLLKSNDIRIFDAALYALRNLTLDKKTMAQLIVSLKNISDMTELSIVLSGLSDSKLEKELKKNIPKINEMLPLIPAPKEMDDTLDYAYINQLEEELKKGNIIAIIEALKDSGTNKFGFNRPVHLALHNLKLEKELKAELITKIIELLKYPKANVRHAAIYALHELKAKKATEQITALLKDTDANVRNAALYFLGDLKVYKAAGEITALLKNKRDNIPDAAIEALGNLRETKVIPLLIDFQSFGFPLRDFKIEQFFWRAPINADLLSFQQKMSDLEQAVKENSQEEMKNIVTEVSRIGEVYPEWLQPYTSQLLAAIKKMDEDFDDAIRIKIQAELMAFAKNEAVEKYILSLIEDTNQPNYLRFAALEGLEGTHRPEIGEFLLQLLQNPKQADLEFPVSHLLINMAYQPAKTIMLQRLAQAENASAILRKSRDNGKSDSSGGKVWQNDYKIYQYAYALARIAPDTDGIELLNHPLYQARQAAIRALAEKADANLIKKLVEHHQAFNPENLPSPLPYSTYQAIDKALEQVEYTGTAQDLTILKQIKGSGIETKMKEQQRAINERFDWTIEELDYRLKHNKTWHLNTMANLQ